MNTETNNHPLPKPTGRSYASVEALMRGEGVPEEVQKKVKQLRAETRLALQLAVLRQKASITQQDMATRLGMTQSAVSKLESGRDEDLTLRVIREYSQASGERLAVVFGKPLTHVEAVKLHAEGIRQHLSCLAELAQGDQDLDRAIQGFFGEAFFNILHILAKCSDKLPKNGTGWEIELRTIAGPTPPPVAKGKKSRTTAIETAQA